MHHPGAPISWDPAKVLQMVNPACGERTCPAIAQQTRRCTTPLDAASFLQAEILLNRMSLRDPSGLLRDDEPLQRLADQVLCKRPHLNAAGIREYAVGNWKKSIQDWVRAQQDQLVNRSAPAGTRSVGRDDERYGDDSDSHGSGYAHSTVPRSVRSPSQRVSRSSVLKSEPVAAAPAPAPVVKAEAAPAVKNEDASFPAIKEEPRDFSHNVFDDLTATPQRLGRKQEEQTPTRSELLRQLRELTIRVDKLEEEKTALRLEKCRLIRRQQDLEGHLDEFYLRRWR